MPLVYDSATAINLGRRGRQEDTVVADFQNGAPYGFAVLADGMGGHAGGDLASKIVVTEVFSELKLRAGDPAAMEAQISKVFKRAVKTANSCLSRYVSHEPAHKGMGATLLAPAIFGQRLYWVSIGDSPLFLFRKGALRRLNANHSMMAHLEKLVRQGRMTPQTARSHPDRACVTSVLAGGKIKAVDCPQRPVKLQVGDIVIAASDGIQTLSVTRLEKLIAQHTAAPAAELSERLMQAVLDAGDPEQDNLSFTVIRMLPAARTSIQRSARPFASPRKPNRRKTTVVATARAHGDQFTFHSLSKSSA